MSRKRILKKPARSLMVDLSSINEKLQSNLKNTVLDSIKNPKLKKEYENILYNEFNNVHSKFQTVDTSDSWVVKKPLVKPRLK